MTIHSRNWEKVFQGGQGFTPEVIAMLAQLEADLASLIVGSGVNSVAAGDSTITIGGTATDPTVALTALAGAGTGPIGDGTHVPVVTIDKWGRVTALTSAAITGGGGTTLTMTGVKTGPYTAAAKDLVVADASGGTVNITLPAAPTDGDMIGVVAKAANADTSLLVRVFDDNNNGIGWSGQSPWTLNYTNEAVILVFNASLGYWDIYATTGLTAAAGDLTGNLPRPSIAANAVTLAKMALEAKLVPTAIKTANYNAAAGDFVPVDVSGGSVVVTLPTNPSDGARVAVQRAIGSSNSLTVAVGSGDSFQSNTTTTITTVNRTIVYYFRKSDRAWLSQLYPTTAVLSVGAFDGSIVTHGTSTAVTLSTGTLDAIASAQPPGADWSNNSHKITSVADPTSAQDAATKNYVDTHASSSFGFVMVGTT